MKNFVTKIYSIVSYLFVDPFMLFNKWRAIPFYLVNIFLYKRQSKTSGFKIDLSNLFCVTYEKFQAAGIMKGHYFYQDIWAAGKIFESKINLHVDVASRIDGFIAHILPYTHVKYIDIREAKSNLKNLEFIKGSIIDLPFEDNSINSLSCLHVIEHIGLGRYGDTIDPEGHIKAAKELVRVLAQGGTLYIGTPIGRERLCFDAHRVFAVQTILDAFSDLQLKEFSLIDDRGEGISLNADIGSANGCQYACGLFEFYKD